MELRERDSICVLEKVADQPINWLISGVQEEVGGALIITVVMCLENS
jgi:hypothetical protein